MVDIKMNYHELTRVTGIPTGTNSPHGDGNGEKVSPVTLDRDVDGDGEALPEEKFPVDI